MQTILDSGIRLVLFFQSLGDWLIGPMDFFTNLGNEEFYLLVAPLLYWCIDARLGLRLGLILMASSGFYDITKVILHSPRPYWIDPQVRALNVETSFGTPSGHAQNAVAVWGLLAAWMRQRWVWLAAGIVIFLIGLSRIYLGVHFPTDALAGWALGALVLWAFLKLEAPVSAWLASLSAAGRLLAALGASLALILLGFLARLGLGGWAIPGDWVQNAEIATGISGTIRPLAYASQVTNAGTLFGLAAGAIFLSANGGYDAGGVLWKRVVRFAIGLIGVLILWRGLAALLPSGETLMALAFRYLRYTLVGLWVTGFAPWLFVRSGLAVGNRRTVGEERPLAPVR